MIRSLRSQLIGGLVLGIALFVGLTAAAIFFMLQQRLTQEFNEDLRLYAGALAGIVEFENGRLLFEWEHYDPTAQMRPDPADGEGYLFRVWLPGDRVLATAPIFEEFTLPRPRRTGIDDWRDLALPDGSRARAVSFFAAPRVDPGQPPPGEGEEVIAITVARRTLAIDRLLGQARWTLLSIALLALVVGVVGVSAFIHYSLRPLTPVIEQLEGLGDSDLSRRVQSGRLHREFLPLVEVINRLLAGLEAKVARERRFVSNAAHEFRNPIAAVRANLEAALLQPHGGNGLHRSLISASIDATSQLQRVCERLLELAGLESGRVVPESHPVDLVEFVESSIADMEQLAGLEDPLDVRWEHRDMVTVQTDPVLLNMVLANLVSNAIAHGSRDEPLGVSVRQTQTGFALTMTNACRAGDDAVPAKERVQSGTPADDWSTDDHHAGLGLTIARRAAERLGGSLSWSSERTNHFVVEMVLCDLTRSANGSTGGSRRGMTRSVTRHKSA